MCIKSKKPTSFKTEAGFFVLLTKYFYFSVSIASKSPSQKPVKADFEGTDEKTVQVISLQGNIILTDKFKGKNYVFKKEFVTGIYFVKLTDGGKTAFKKMIITN